MHLVRRLMTKWTKTKALEKEAQEALDAIASTAPPQSLAQWAEDKHQAQSQCWVEPDVMNIFDIKVNKGIHLPSEPCHH